MVRLLKTFFRQLRKGIQIPDGACRCLDPARFHLYGKGNPVLSDAGAENQLSLKGISGVQALYICPVGNLYLLPGKTLFSQKKTAMGGIGDPFYPAPILCCYDQLSP